VAGSLRKTVVGHKLCQHPACAMTGQIDLLTNTNRFSHDPSFGGALNPELQKLTVWYGLAT
jgi:hypothetical protein